MQAAEKRRQFLTVINLILTALILIGVIIVAGWLLMMEQRINELSAASGEMAIQLTLQSTLDAYQEEISSDAPLENTPQPTEEIQEPTDEETTLAPTATPKPSEFTDAYFSQIKLLPNPMLDELSESRYFRLPPLSFQFPEGWTYRYNTNGKLTVIDSFGHETSMSIMTSNSRKEFILNDIGRFDLLADGTLSWYPDTTPRQGLGAGEYQLWLEIGEYTSEPIAITVDDAPMSRILEAVSMYRTYDDLVEDRRYLSFASQQEPMAMFGYMIQDDGSIYIRVWRSHDKFYYWVKGDHVMHPDLGILYNDMEDLLNEEGSEIIPQIEITSN